MPIQAPQWSEFLSCPICFNIFDEGEHRPISLACGHTVCRICLSKLTPKKCPFDQNVISRAIEDLPVNFALLQLVGVAVPEAQENKYNVGLAENVEFYNSARKCIEELAIYLKPINKDAGNTTSPVLSRPMQRKLITLVNCQLIEDEGRCRAVRAARSLGERTVTELILQHQNPQQLSANLWAGVRARGCQFLGPAMQEEVLKLILLALEDGSALSRKVLVLFVVQRLEAQYPQASKTAIGHVVQLLYRASCFMVTKRDEESSLMQLKEEFRSYEALRREHDSQIVQIATEAGLRISPEQWSSLLYGDTAHKSHMQSIIDKLQTPQSFIQSISELTIALQRTGDPGGLAQLKPHLDLLSSIDPGPESISPSWETVDLAMMSIKAVVEGLVDFTNSRNVKKQDLMPLHNPKYKTSMCRDLIQKGKCPRGQSCTFAHSQEEMEKNRQRNKKSASQVIPRPSVMSPPVPPMVSTVLVTETQNIFSEICSRSICSEGRDVSVPIVKPCSLPSNMKAKRESSIYASSDLKPAKDPLRPDIIPVVKQSQKSQYLHHNQGKQPSAALCYMPPSNSNNNTYPNYPQGTAMIQPDHYNQASTSPAQWGISAMPPSASGGANGGGSGAGGGTGIDPLMMDEAMIRRMITMMPANPYTIDRCGLNARDTVYYNSLVIRARGKSPSKQLEELQNRKKELLSQLNKTKAPSDQSFATVTTSSDYRKTTEEKSNVSQIAQYSMDASQTEVTPSGGQWPVYTSSNTSNRAVSNGRSDINSPTEHKTDVSLAKSLADSKATSLISMTLAKCDDSVEPLPSELYDLENCVIKDKDWSSADEEVTMYTSVQSQKIFNNLSNDETHSWPDDDDWIHGEYYVSSHVLDDNDEFVPFSEETAAISKYGPISRMIKTKMKQAAPVQVTAGQPKDTTPVTAVTPLQRPHPITSQVPSRFNIQSPTSNQLSMPKLSPPTTEVLPEKVTPNVNRNHGDHKPDPNGVYVATSLPTALLQPNVIATANRIDEPHQLWTLKQRIVDPNHRPTETASAYDSLGKEKLQNEIAHITSKIQHLQSSEDDRLMRELNAIELNILEAERQVEIENEQETPVVSPYINPTVNYHHPSAAATSPSPWEQTYQGGSLEQPPSFQHYQSGQEQPQNFQHGGMGMIAPPQQYATGLGAQMYISQVGGPTVDYHHQQQVMTNYTNIREHVGNAVCNTATMVHSGQISAKEAMDYQLAREAQLIAMSQQQARIAQESEDRRFAEDIAMQEMEKFVRSSIADDDH